MATQECTPERTYCVYRIVCFPTGKVYVGKTYEKSYRRASHFAALRRGDHPNPHLQNAYNKYGPQAFYFETLELNISADAIDERERYWIAHFDSFENGFNQTEGGGAGAPVTKPCAWNGIGYESVTQAAIANNMHKDTMGYHIKLGHTCDADISQSGAYHAKECAWNGVVYPSIAECARAIGVNRASLQERLEKGYTCDEDMPGIVKPITWNGVDYPSVKAAANALGINSPALHGRLKRGIVGSGDMKGEKSVVWNGIEYPSRTAAAKALNVHVQTIHHRIRRGYTCDDDLRR